MTKNVLPLCHNATIIALLLNNHSNMQHWSFNCQLFGQMKLFLLLWFPNGVQIH
jgi:hypothetical protein